MTRTEISKDPSGRIIASSLYSPLLVSIVNTIKAHRRRHVEKFGIFGSYTHMSTETIGKINSPLDNLDPKRGDDV
jgi:hypothetical protein